MKNPEVDSKGFTTLLWLSSYGKTTNELPNNFCNFFWESVLSYVLAIFALPGHIINLISRKTHTVIAIWWSFHVPIALVLRQCVMPEGTFDFSFIGYLYGLMYSIEIVAALATFFGIILGVITLKDKWEDIREEKQRALRELEMKSLMEQGLEYREAYEKVYYSKRTKRPLGIITWWKAFKGKYCPKIEWKNLSPIETTDDDDDWN